jgi:transposase
MPRAIPHPLRAEIVHRHAAGQSLRQIATELQLCYRSVRGIWQRYRTLGNERLAPDYARCGRPAPRFPAALHEAALAAKREHPTWGAPLIRLTLAEQFADQALPSVRTLQEWFRQAGLQPVRTRRPSAPRQRARVAHAVWQLDGKEGMRLADGTPTVALNLVDEASGAVLSAAVFPPDEMHAGPRAPGAGLVGSGLCGGGVAGAPASG